MIWDGDKMRKKIIVLDFSDDVNSAAIYWDKNNNWPAGRLQRPRYQGVFYEFVKCRYVDISSSTLENSMNNNNLHDLQWKHFIRDNQMDMSSWINKYTVQNWI